MPNGEALNEELEFEERIKNLSPDERSIFLAKQAYALTSKFDRLEKKFDECSGMGYANKKVSALSGGLTGGIAAVLIVVIQYFRSR